MSQTNYRVAMLHYPKIQHSDWMLQVTSLVSSIQSALFLHNLKIVFDFGARGQSTHLTSTIEKIKIEKKRPGFARHVCLVSFCQSISILTI